jgi:hypothetical protein
MADGMAALAKLLADNAAPGTGASEANATISGSFGNLFS